MFSETNNENQKQPYHDSIDMKERVNFIVMSIINFVVVGPQEVIIYSNEGISHASPNFKVSFQINEPMLIFDIYFNSPLFIRL